MKPKLEAVLEIYITMLSIIKKGNKVDIDS